MHERGCMGEVQDTLVIGSRLDASASDKSCRLALYGRLCAPLEACSPAHLAALQVFKVKRRSGAQASSRPSWLPSRHVRFLTASLLKLCHMH